MNRICPECGRSMEWIPTSRTEEFEIKKEKIAVAVEFYQCGECGAEFEDMNARHDPYNLAYEEYRKRKGMVHPSQITEFRKKYGLTQKELSDLLGFGGVTLSRYENGALQDEAHDQLLKFILDPKNLFNLTRQKSEVLQPEKRDILMEQLKKEIIHESIFEEFYINEKPDISNGHRQLDTKKITELIKFFTYPNGVVKSKLLKLMFYADFKHFQKNGVSITGLRYAHLTYGPVPDHYDHLLASILESGEALKVNTQQIGDYIGEIFISEEPAASGAFNADEMETVRYVNEKFIRFTAKDIEEFSHQEKGYLETRQGFVISYSFAAQLQI